MGLSVISDIHVKKRNDPAYGLLLSFLSHQKVQGSDCIYLLGDIFDFMCGGHTEYMREYPEFFSLVKELIQQGKIFYYFEGNHDFHLTTLFQKFLEENSLEKRNFVLCKGGLVKILWNKKYYFSHGDELQAGNYSYHVWKKILQSAPINYLVEKVVPYPVLSFIGDNASNLSRSRTKRKSYDYSLIRESFRQGAVELGKKISPHFIICGHGHIRDDYSYDDFGLSFRYLNNGQALESKTFIHIEKNKVEFVLL